MVQTEDQFSKSSNSEDKPSRVHFVKDGTVWHERDPLSLTVSASLWVRINPQYLEYHIDRMP